MALSASRPLDTTPVDQAGVNNDVEALFKAGQGMSGTDEVYMLESTILISSSSSFTQTRWCSATSLRPDRSHTSPPCTRPSVSLAIPHDLFPPISSIGAYGNKYRSLTKVIKSELFVLLLNKCFSLLIVLRLQLGAHASSIPPHH
jgi:hypothetical protein